jgi:hypothetical protein
VRPGSATDRHKSPLLDAVRIADALRNSPHIISADVEPGDDVAYAADRLLTSDASDRNRALAGLLNYAAATWDRHDVPLREHAQAVARSLTW